MVIHIRIVFVFISVLYCVLIFVLKRIRIALHMDNFTIALPYIDIIRT